jgi:hypothetical protein
MTGKPETCKTLPSLSKADHGIAIHFLDVH